MKYLNAAQILPGELLEQIQTYADGVYLYIPRRAEEKRRWGTGTDTRLYLHQRNHAIYRDHLDGASVEALAEQYFLSVKSIQRILSQIRKTQ